MVIIGCDFHSGFQQLAIFDNRTGEIEEKKLLHVSKAREFYGSLTEPVVVGMESGVPCQWFRRLLAECGHQLRVGDAGKIRAAEPRKQKTDRRDAELILRLLLEDRFPQVWMPSEQDRDARQLLMDRHHRMRMQAKCKNQLQALALNQGLKRGYKLWTEAGLRALGGLEMSEHAARRREHLLAMVAELGRQLAELDVRIAGEVQRRPDARRLMTHPGVGAQTALGMVLTIGDAGRFATSRQVASYLGLVPSEHSSGGRQRLGTHHQARFVADALLAGAGRAECGSRRRATATRLRAPGSEEESSGGQGDGGQETGRKVVLDAPQ